MSIEGSYQIIRLHLQFYQSIHVTATPVTTLAPLQIIVPASKLQIGSFLSNLLVFQKSRPAFVRILSCKLGEMALAMDSS